MPYLDNQDEDQNQQGGSQSNPLANTAQPAGGNPPPAPSTPPSAPTLGAQGGGSITGSQVPSAGKPTSSGRFQNLQNFIKANKPQAGQQGFAGKVVGKVQNVQQGAAGQLQQSQQDFAKQAAEGAANITNVDESVGQGIASAANTEQAAQQLEQLNKGLASNYAGPKELVNQEALIGQQQNLQGIAQASGSEGGRFGLLKQFFGRPSYTQGQTKLDNLLLQSDRGQLNELRSGSKKSAAEFAGGLSAAQTEATAKAGELQNQAAAAKAAATQVGASARDTIRQQLEAQAAQANANEEARAAAIARGDRTSILGALSPEARAALEQAGIGTDDPSALLGLTGQNYQRGFTSAGNVNRARAELLNKLVGSVGGQGLDTANAATQGGLGINAQQIQQLGLQANQDVRDILGNVIGNQSQISASTRDRLNSGAIDKGLVLQNQEQASQVGSALATSGKKESRAILANTFLKPNEQNLYNASFGNVLSNPSAFAGDSPELQQAIESAKSVYIAQAKSGNPGVAAASAQAVLKSKLDSLAFDRGQYNQTLWGQREALTNLGKKYGLGSDVNSIIKRGQG